MVNVRKLNDTIAELETEVESIKKIVSLIERIDNITYEQKISLQKIVEINENVDKLEKVIHEELNTNNEKINSSVQQLYSVIDEIKLKYDELKIELTDNITQNIETLSKENSQHLFAQEKILSDNFNQIKEKLDSSIKEICFNIDNLNKQVSQLYIKHDQDTEKLNNTVLAIQDNQKNEMDKLENLINYILKIQGTQKLILIGIIILIVISIINIII